MEFIREQIKEKPINKKRLAMKIGTAALCGLVFALAACIVLLIFMPVLKNAIAMETEGTEATEPESETEKVVEATQETEGTENSDQEIVIPPDLSLSISDYQTLQNELYAVGNEVNKSIVTVTSMTSETDWMNNSFEAEGQGSGVIISEDNNYLYILAERKIISDGAHIRVSFINGTGADATILKYDGNTGIAILTVEKRQLDADTREAVSVAKIGSSYGVTNGSIVIALGSPLGTNYSVLTGNVTSIANEIATQDKNYSVFTTDIIASENGSGILINTNGEIIGVVMQSFSGSQDTNTLTAVAVDELSSMIENLINGRDIPYVGLYVSTVTDDISKDYDIPKGVYIREVATDSPAMRAGLQSGDVIVEVNGEDVSTDMVYSNKISQLIPGTTCEITVKRQNGNVYYDVTCEVEIGVLQ